jgi:GDSL-like Lipase/Acylhydrolase family
MKAAIDTAFLKALILIGIFLFYHESKARADEVVVLGALGDSITVACNATSLGDNPALSWSTGTDTKINSHLKRLALSLKSDIQGVNLAVSGAKVVDLRQQTNAMINHKPDYLTIEIGANDLCAWKDDYTARILQFGIELRSNVATIVESNPKVKILLASIPDMYALWEVGARRPECQLRWNLFGLCTPLLSSNVTTQDRAAFVERWRIVNATIASVAEAFPQNVIFNSAVASARITSEHVSSIDCFHPSVQGQNLLADKAWPYMMSLTR